MWKYLVASLMVLLAFGGLGAAQVEECTDCYANIITQKDCQIIDTVRLGWYGSEDMNVTPSDASELVAVGNEGLTAGIIITPKAEEPANGSMFTVAPFARIDQAMCQNVSNLGSEDPFMGEGAKGVTWNKAIQAAWIAGQGYKENETVAGESVWVKEGAWISQDTQQTINNVYDYDSREQAKVLNVDNKLAMIVDNLSEVINISARASSETTDNQSSSGKIYNEVNGSIRFKDPA